MLIFRILMVPKKINSLEGVHFSLVAASEQLGLKINNEKTKNVYKKHPDGESENLQ